MTRRNGFMAHLVLLVLASCACAQDNAAPATAKGKVGDAIVGLLCLAVLGLVCLVVVVGAVSLVVWLVWRGIGRPEDPSAPAVAAAAGGHRAKVSRTGGLADIPGTEGLTGAEIADEIRRGGKFVVYRYVISVIFISLMRTSGVHFIRAGESPGRYAIRFNVLSCLFGWWGIPWGPIFTIRALTSNGSGIDVTDSVLGAVARHSG
jgi:hypothetical protein